MASISDRNINQARKIVLSPRDSEMKFGEYFIDDLRQSMLWRIVSKGEIIGTDLLGEKKYFRVVESEPENRAQVTKTTSLDILAHPVGVEGIPLNQIIDVAKLPEEELIEVKSFEDIRKLAEQDRLINKYEDTDSVTYFACGYVYKKSKTQEISGNFP